MAPRTPPLAERLAEPWEGVKYTSLTYFYLRTDRTTYVYVTCTRTFVPRPRSN